MASKYPKATMYVRLVGGLLQGEALPQGSSTCTLSHHLLEPTPGHLNSSSCSSESARDIGRHVTCMSFNRSIRILVQLEDIARVLDNLISRLVLCATTPACMWSGLGSIAHDPGLD